MNVTSCCNPDMFVQIYKDPSASLQEMLQNAPYK